MLHNVTLHLWNNGADGLKVDCSINYGFPEHKQFTTRLGAKQTHRTWCGFNRDQPPALEEFFENFKTRHAKDLKTVDFDWWVSKFSTKTAKNGPIVLPAALLLFGGGDLWGFAIQLQDRYFKGDFSETGLSKKQTTPNREGKFCMGRWSWQERPTPEAGTLW